MAGKSIPSISKRPSPEGKYSSVTRASIIIHQGIDDNPQSGVIPFREGYHPVRVTK